MGLTIQNFRAQGAALGGSNLETNRQGEAIVRSGKTAWIKSLLNIGDARQANARTVASLRQAVHSDPQYARVTAQADSLLDRMGAKAPLTGRKITQFLDQMDAAAQKADETLIAHNKGLVSTYAMREMSPIDQYAATMYGDRSFHLSATDKAMLNAMISDRVIANAGDFRAAPREADIRGIVRNTVQEFINLQARLDRSDLPPDIKEIVKSQFSNGGSFMPLETLEQIIPLRENIQANQTLQRSLTDVSTSDAPLRNALSRAMSEAGIVVAVDARALEGLGAAIRTAIDKAGHMGQRAVSREEGEAFVLRQITTFIEAYQLAGTLGSPAEQAFLRNLVVTGSSPVTPAYLRALSERAAAIPVEAFASLSNASSPDRLMNELESLSRLLAEGFSTLEEGLTQEGAEGRASYLEHCLGLALAHGNVSVERARALFDGLNSPMGKSVRDMLTFASGEHPAMGSAKVTLLTAMQCLGHAGGVDVDRFMAEEFARPVPRNAAELSVDLRALLPGFRPVSGNVPLRPPLDLGAELQSAEQDFMIRMSENIQLQMSHHMSVLDGGDDTPAFEKDIRRGGLGLTLGGTTLRRFSDIPEESLLRPGETSISADERTRRRQAASVTNGYDAFAKLVTGRSEALFSSLSPQDRTKVLILTSMANQETEKTSLTQGLRAPAPDFEKDAPEGFVLSLLLDDRAQRDMEFNITPDGDFVIRLHSKMSTNGIAMPNAGSTTMLDPARSSISVASTLTVSWLEMERLSQLDWELIGYVPENYQIQFTESRLSGEIRLFEEQR